MTTYTSPFSGNVIVPTDVSYAAYDFIDLAVSEIQLEWPTNTSTSQYPAARIMDITSGVSSILIMPPANQVSVGQDALIRNIGLTSFTVQDYNGGTIVSVPSGKSVYIYVTDNVDASGVWGVIDFGAGTSGGTSSELAGLGLLAQASTLAQSHPAQAVPDGYTMLDTDRAQTLIWSGGTGSVYLPIASSVGNNWFTLFKNNGSGTITIYAQGTNLINQSVSKTFQPDEDAFIICDGTNFITIGYGSSSNFFFTALIKPVTSGSVYLTTQEATSVIQEYTGSLTGNVTVYYPPVVALYVIANQTTDNGYSLSITTGVSGGAIVYIPSGQQATVMCDGVNFYNANTIQAGGSTTQLVDGSASSPSLNFISEPSTGIYRPGLGDFAISVLGSNKVTISSTSATFTENLYGLGTGNFINGISGGVF